MNKTEREYSGQTGEHAQVSVVSCFRGYVFVKFEVVADEAD